MAKSTQETIELGRLIRRSEAARLRIGEAHARLKHRLDLPSRIKNSVKSEPVKWLGGSLIAGFAGSLLFGSKKKQPSPRIGKSKVKSNKLFSLGIVGLLVQLAKPLAKIYATKLLKDYLEVRMRAVRTGMSGRRAAEAHEAPARD